jgi:hypothetical protein
LIPVFRKDKFSLYSLILLIQTLILDFGSLVISLEYLLDSSDSEIDSDCPTKESLSDCWWSCSLIRHSRHWYDVFDILAAASDCECQHAWALYRAFQSLLLSDEVFVDYCIEWSHHHDLYWSLALWAVIIYRFLYELSATVSIVQLWWLR